MGDKNEMLDRLRSMFNDEKMKIPNNFTALMNERTLYGLPESKWRSPSNFGGIDIVTHDMIEPGMVCLVQKNYHQLNISTADFNTPVEFDMSIFNRAYSNLIASMFGVPDKVVSGPYKWELQSGETIIAWGIRLDQRGLLDDPDKRWAYQKVVWSIPLDVVIKRLELASKLFFRKMRGE